MASTLGRSDRDLKDEITQNASGFSFFQVNRLLALITREEGRGCNGSLPDGLRFRTPASLGFPASEVLSYRRGKRDVPREGGAPDERAAQDELTVNFFGLTGPSGVLPRAYTELLLERQQLFGDSGAHAFFDLFSHRALSLFNQSWRKYQCWLSVEDGEPDGFIRHLLDVCGLGFQGLRDNFGREVAGRMDEALFIRYAGLLSQKPLSAQAIQTLVEESVGAPACLQQFAGQWMAVAPDEQSRLGCNSCELGASALAGARVWDRQGRVVLRVGPLRRAQFDRMLPGKPGALELKALLGFALGHAVACDVTLVLDRRDVPDARLQQDRPLLLGGNAWLESAPSGHDPDQMIYRLLQ
jgi:type VI secretion system protein ImpH